MKRFLLAIAFASIGGAALAQQGAPVHRAEIWDLTFGAAAAEQPAEFVDFACGTNGGPPSLPLKGFADFKRCKPEASGLREVYFRYDDEMEYWARANNLAGEIERYGGTKTYGFPIVASALFSDAGLLRGIRLVSDPRFDDNRDEAYLLKNFLSSRFGRDNWSCADLPPEDGETPVDGVFFKQRCEKNLDDGRTAAMLVRHMRKAGQERFDPHSGKQTVNQFESSTRFELVAK
jgi:hypothetical protein